MTREFDARRVTDEGEPYRERAAVVPSEPSGGDPPAIATVVSPSVDYAAHSGVVERAKARLQSAASTGQRFRVDSSAVTTSSGAAAVHARQELLGIPVFQAAAVVRFASEGAFSSTDGRWVMVDRHPSPKPKLEPVEAAVVAARFVATPGPDEVGAKDSFGEPVRVEPIDLSGFSPQVVSREEGAESRVFLGGAPFQETISASLVWFELHGDLRLAWQVILQMPESPWGQGEKWRILVDAHMGKILYSHCLTLHVAARGNVYLPDGGSARRLLAFPLPPASYGLPLPNGMPPGFPRDWVDADRTDGNAVNGHLGPSGASITGAVADGVMTFDPADATGNDQRVLNIFFLCNYMHDYLYLLGYREADGNYQRDNFGAGGLGMDNVDARAFPGAVNGTANWSPDAADGNAPVTNMGLVTATNRHTAFDSGVVFHEYTHGLTSRLVGGPANDDSLDAFQSGSMGEGWGDYMACTINDTQVVGAWVLNNANGIRGFRYDTNFPDHYGMLGTGRYDEVHNAGEIWCAALMEMNRRIGAKLAVQCVVDGLKLTPSNPTFLQARDAILAAIVHKASADKWNPSDRRNRLRGAWVAFARFGMGIKAKSGPSWGTAGIVADFTIPGELDTVGPWAADFVGSSRAEVLTNKVSDGNWNLATFNASGQLLMTPVANTLGFGDLGDGQHLAWVGDFTGSGKAQILFNYVGDGNWWLGTLVGYQLTFKKVANTRGFGNLADGNHPAFVGDFTGSGKAQILFNYTGDGNWWLGSFAGGQLSFAKVGNTHGFGDLADGSHPSWVGEFTGSGKSEVLFNYVGDGNWWLGTMANGQLLFARVGNTRGFGDLADGNHPSWVGKFTDTERAQVLFNYVGDGNWWLGTLSGGQLTFGKVGNTVGFGNLADGRHPAWTGDFSGSTSTEILFNYVDDGNWWLGSFAAGQLGFSKVANTLGFGDLADGAHPAWVGDFNGSSKDEILFNYYGDGNWWLGTFASGRLAFSRAGTT